MLNKEVFLAWEKLRVIYNAILLLVATILLANAYWPGNDLHPDVEFSSVLIKIMACAVAANALYFLGPIVESYIRWLGADGRYWRFVFFGAGFAISLLIEVGLLVVMLSPF